jgi:hypothetical protein
MRKTVKEAAFITSLLSELPQNFIQQEQFLEKAMLIRTDSQSAMTMAKNPTFHNRTKHIDIQYHFV